MTVVLSLKKVLPGVCFRCHSTERVGGLDRGRVHLVVVRHLRRRAGGRRRRCRLRARSRRGERRRRLRRLSSYGVVALDGVGEFVGEETVTAGGAGAHSPAPKNTSRPTVKARALTDDANRAAPPS